MFSQQVLSKVREHFPNFRLGYKNQSLLMRMIGFFSGSFLKRYATSLGNTTYFPTPSFVNTKPITSVVILLHELVHLYDARKLGFWFKPSYLLPQILAIPFIFLLFVMSWKLVLPLLALTILPWPAYFRMRHEKRAYLASLYCMDVLNKKFGYHINLKSQADFFIEQFSGWHYYFMFPFEKIEREFSAALIQIDSGSAPYNDPELFMMLNDILAAV